MRKLMLFSFVILSVAYMSCNSAEGGMSTTAKKNLEVNTAIMKAYESGDFSKMGDYIAADAVDHGGEKGDIKGLENIVAEMKRYKEMVKDAKVEVVKEMVDDEYVMVWSKTSGTLTMDGMGMKAGDKTNMTGVDVAKFKDGKAVEHWIFMDVAEMNKMMQAMMPSTNSIPGDTILKMPKQ
ncbi:MAG: ester cyclase [Bacteroidetes bacterium]|nr:MAG: ester cyclase [Bacteroidota bacterium]